MTVTANVVVAAIVIAAQLIDCTPRHPPVQAGAREDLHKEFTGSSPLGHTRSLFAENRVCMSQRTEPDGVIGVAIHDVEPATWERCALIRDWLDDHGIDRVTLLVIPARDLHPLGERCPEMSAWLRERRGAGDAIAQNGFRHEPLGADPADGRGVRALRSRRSEFAGLDEREARRVVDAGWRVLKLSGIEPDGFVAPGYAYTRQLLKVLPGASAGGRRCCTCAPRLPGRPVQRATTAAWRPPGEPAPGDGWATRSRRG